MDKDKLEELLSKYQIWLVVILASGLLYFLYQQNQAYRQEITDTNTLLANICVIHTGEEVIPIGVGLNQIGSNQQTILDTLNAHILGVDNGTSTKSQ